jgi:enterobacteria phage integrase
MAGETPSTRTVLQRDAPGTIGALIASYMQTGAFIALRATSKAGYMTRLETMRVDHGHRSISGLTRDRINTFMLRPFRSAGIRARYVENAAHTHPACN